MTSLVIWASSLVVLCVLAYLLGAGKKLEAEAAHHVKKPQT
jgi:hypothetical protein